MSVIRTISTQLIKALGGVTAHDHHLLHDRIRLASAPAIELGCYQHAVESAFGVPYSAGEARMRYRQCFGRLGLYGQNEGDTFTPAEQLDVYLEHIRTEWDTLHSALTDRGTGRDPDELVDREAITEAAHNRLMSVRNRLIRLLGGVSAHDHNVLLSKVRVSERLATAHIAQLGSYQRFLASIYHYEGHYPVWKAQYEYRQCLTAWVDTLFEQRAWFSIEQLEQIDLYLGRIVDAFATLYKHHRPAFMHLQTSLWHDDHLPYARGAHLFRSWEVVAQEREADLIEARLIKKAPGKGVAVLIPCLTAAHEQPKDLKAPYLFDNELSQEEQAQVKFRLYLNGVEINRLLGYDDFMIWLDTYQISPYSKRAAQIECGVPVDTSDGTVRWDRIAPL